MAGPTTLSLPIPDFSPTGSQPPAQPFDPNPGSNPTPAPGVPSPTPSTPSTPSGGQPSSSSGGGPTPSIVDNYKVKALLLRNALTSHYVCKFQPPDPALAFIQQGGVNYNNPTSQELIELSCSEASLPGSSMMTNEINDDHTGVTERHAYRKQYDDRIDFTFYVDRNYDIITFFERWISYCAGENLQTALETKNYFYRVNFPGDYQTEALYVTKFERDVFGTALEYKFIGAYPISITSMPISYDSSQLLKCTVSFTYIRYVRKVVKATRPTEPGQTTPLGVPSVPPITTTTGDQLNVPLPPTTTDGRPVPPFPVDAVAAGVPQLSLENIARPSNITTSAEPYNKSAGTGAVTSQGFSVATENNSPSGSNTNSRPGAPTTNARPGSPARSNNLTVV